MAGELILIVEDNDKNRKLVRDVLAHEGYRLLETDNGEEAVRLAQAERPALVLMDIQLPGIDGMEALRRLRADAETRAIPVVAVTASAMTQDRATIIAAGFACVRSSRPCEKRSTEARAHDGVADPRRG